VLFRSVLEELVLDSDAGLLNVKSIELELFAV